MKEYAEVCHDFVQFPGVPIDQGKVCLACWHFFQHEENCKIWECERRTNEIKRKSYIESQAKGQTVLLEELVVLAGQKETQP